MPCRPVFPILFCSMWDFHCFSGFLFSHTVPVFKFSLSGSDPYHKSCYRELHHPKCDVCHKFVRTFYLVMLVKLAYEV